MTAPTGRREANKQATRAALLTAAKSLFADRGFEATTVRDIARAAKVTERTFYRYFDGKEGLIADEYLSWLGILRDAIVARPRDEAPLTAVQRAMMSIGRQAASGGPPAPLWLFGGGPPMRSLRRSAPRPLLRLEASIAEAILVRTRASASAGGQDRPRDGREEFTAQVVSRVAVAALRSAIIVHGELVAAQESSPRTVDQLLGEAFAIIGDEAKAGQ